MDEFHMLLLDFIGDLTTENRAFFCNVPNVWYIE